ncbi:MAG TPA: Crp/Fnr family transcriptional regulator [Bacteroidales bacterium]|nr:Crp/Fnr family transcriptional regulator [Bacteroidales bacterium]
MKTIYENDKDFICDINTPCFKNLLPEEVQLVKAGKTQVFFRKGDNLTKQGAFASYILFIIKGMAKQYLEGEGTKNFNLRIIKQGEFVGLSAVFDENIFNYSSIALTDCQVFLIEKEIIARVIKQNGLFGFSIIKRYCEQNVNLLNTVRNIMYKQMNGRMADALLYIDSLKTESEDIFQLLSRKDIADFAGISTESAVKLLKTFEREGLIELHERDIRLLKQDALIEISRRG